MEDKMDKQREDNLLFTQGWTSELLLHMQTHPKVDSPKLMHHCSQYHYNLNQMDNILQPFVGDLEGFIEFLTKEWGWIVKYNAKEKTLIADENKEFCVCPIVNNMDDKKISPLLCHCSEGFAKLMFRKVIGSEVSAEVISSILRGDKSCIYQIKFNQ